MNAFDPLLITAAAILFVGGLSAALVLRWQANPPSWLPAYFLTTPDPQEAVEAAEVTVSGRHRLANATTPYRPHTAPVIPGPGPLTTAETRSRAIPMPVTEPVWRRADTAPLDIPMPPAPDATALRLAAEDHTFLEGVAAQPPHDGPDPFAWPDAPVAWFESPHGATRQLKKLS